MKDRKEDQKVASTAVADVIVLRFLARKLKKIKYLMKVVRYIC